MVKSKLPPGNGYVASRQLEPIDKMGPSSFFSFLQSDNLSFEDRQTEKPKDQSSNETSLFR